MSARGSKVSSDRPASSGNQKYMCSSLSVNRSPLLTATRCRLPPRDASMPSSPSLASVSGGSTCESHAPELLSAQFRYGVLMLHMQ